MGLGFGRGYRAGADEIERALFEVGRERDRIVVVNVPARGAANQPAGMGETAGDIAMTDRPSIDNLAVPYDVGAEGAVLGSMIVDPHCIAGVLARGVTRDDFYLAEHKEIFDAVMAVHGRIGRNGDGGVDGLLVREELERRRTLEQIGGTEYLRQVIETVPSAASVQYYSEIIQDRRSRRMMLVAGEKLLRGARDLGTPVTEELAGARMDLEEIGVPGEETAPDIAVLDAAAWLTTEPPDSDQIIGDTFDAGDKVAIIGSSKLRKSFFLLQGMLSIASGRDFLGWTVPKARRVAIVQFEIQQHHFHRRVRRMAAGLGIEPQDIADRLRIVNARGLALSGAAGIKSIADAVKPFHPEVICLDPLYKVATGAENAAEDLKVVLGLFDTLAEQTGAAVVYVHHDAKGFAGDRQTADRGSGSGVLGRDYDACMTLTPHASDDDAIVVESLLRNYRPQGATTIGWQEDDAGGYRFELRPDLSPTKRTSTNNRDAVSFDAAHPVALAMLAKGPMLMEPFKDELGKKTGLGEKRIDRYVRWAFTAPEDPLDTLSDRGKGKHDKYIGTPDQIAHLKETL